MEGITHVLSGIFVQLMCFKYLVFPFNLIFTIILGFFSHFVIDTLAKLTYHTPESHKEDKFWVWWHIITLALALIVAVWMMIIGLFFFYLLGGIMANLVDIWDWTILRPIQNKKKKENPDSTWGEGYFIHPAIDWIRDKALSFLPNLNRNKKGVINEIITITILWVLIVIFF